jgi:hypothetical protein
MSDTFCNFENLEKIEREYYGLVENKKFSIPIHLDSEITQENIRVSIIKILENCKSYRKETYFASLNLFWYVIHKIPLDSAKLDSYAMTCLLLSTYYEEICRKSKSFCAKQCGATKVQITKIREEIWRTTEYGLRFPNIQHYIRYMSTCLQECNLETHNMVGFLAMLVAMEMPRFLPSRLVHGIFIVAYLLMDIKYSLENSPNEVCENIFQLSTEEIEQVTYFVIKTLKNVTKNIDYSHVEKYYKKWVAYDYCKFVEKIDKIDCKKPFTKLPKISTNLSSGKNISIIYRNMINCGDIIGKGAYGVVHRDFLNKKYHAIKFFKCDEGQLGKFPSSYVREITLIHGPSKYNEDRLHYIRLQGILYGTYGP